MYSRMEAERERVAREFRSQGSEAAERVRADADKQKKLFWRMPIGNQKSEKGKAMLKQLRSMPTPMVLM